MNAYLILDAQELNSIEPYGDIAGYAQKIETRFNEVEAINYGFEGCTLHVTWDNNVPESQELSFDEPCDLDLQRDIYECVGMIRAEETLDHDDSLVMDAYDAWNAEENSVEELRDILETFEDEQIRKSIDLSKLKWADKWADSIVLQRAAEKVGPVWVIDRSGDCLMGEAADEVTDVDDLEIMAGLEPDYYFAETDANGCPDYAHWGAIYADNCEDAKKDAESRQVFQGTTLWLAAKDKSIMAVRRADALDMSYKPEWQEY